MQQQFNALSGISEAEAALREWQVPYEKGAGGAIVVPGTLDISHRELTHLPDLSAVTVNGRFRCIETGLTSLRGSPRIVIGDVICQKNPLASLEGAPQDVGGAFLCDDCRLTSLAGAPKQVGTYFSCLRNSSLASLEDAPQACIFSDFGVFPLWKDVPEHLRLSPETKARQERDAIIAATVLQDDIRIGRPLRLRRKDLDAG